MHNIDSKYLKNSFIVIGHTGYGKSTTCKAITGNENIDVSSSFHSKTNNVSYYPGTINHLIGKTYFTMIDTPGLDDSEGRDKEIYEDLRSMLQTRDMGIKGIFIVFNFQMTRFGKSEKDILDKIINLVPIKNLWKYITILVTHFYTSNPKKLENKKNEFIAGIKEIIENEYFPKTFSKYGIMGNFKDINLVFTDFDEEDPTIEQAKEITKIIENSVGKEPLFQSCCTEVQDNVSVIEFEDLSKKSAILYKCKIKTLKYIGQNGNTLNEIRIIESKKKEREIQKSELNSKNAFIAGGVTYGIGLVALAGLAFPPLEIAACIGYLGAMGASAISSIVGWTKVGINVYKNWDFKNDEITEYLDESK